MRTKVKVMKKEVLEERLAKDECHHYWLIESAKGRTSRGVCKICGATKDFFNSIPLGEPTVAKRRAPFQELPQLDIRDNEPSTS